MKEVCSCGQNEAPFPVWEALDEALNEMFLSVLKVDLETNTVDVLQSRDSLSDLRETLDWTTYLNQYQALMTNGSFEKMMKALSAQALLARANQGEKRFAVEVSYKRQGDPLTNWVTISVVFRKGEEGRWAFVFVQQSNEEHLRKDILNMYVYQTCDHFIFLDAKHNRYTTFSGSDSGTPLLPDVCEDYEAALVNYARNFVVPEDREMTIREMHLPRVLEQLERHGVHTFYVGVNDPVRGYTRKQLTYQYYDRGAQMILLSRTDVTGVYLEEQARQQELNKARLAAMTDPLTGVLNPKGMEDRVTEVLLAGESFGALLFIDLDNFKQVNDNFGHQEGDRLLRRVAEVMEAQTLEKDLLGRAGGDEFLVFLRDIPCKGRALDCAHRICEGVSRLSLPESGSISITCSIGIALSPQDGRDYSTLVWVADRRLYLAKTSGKNQFFLE